MQIWSYHGNVHIVVIMIWMNCLLGQIPFVNKLIAVNLGANYKVPFTALEK